MSLLLETAAIQKWGNYLHFEINIQKILLWSRKVGYETFWKISN